MLSSGKVRFGVKAAYRLPAEDRKMEARTMEARTIPGFFEALSASKRSNGVFRGHSDESWQLIPGLFRSDVHILPKGNYRSIEDTLLVRFFQLAEPYLNKPEKRSALRDRIIAQHYGLRTSLLDWTKNPLVALYFACDHYDQNGKVFLVETRATIHNEISSISDDYLDKVELVQIIPPNLDVRIIAQSSRFTLQSFPKDGESFIPLEERFPEAGKNDTNQRAHFSVILIPNDAKPSLKQELNDYGVNELSVFPELQSVGRYLSQHLTGHYRGWTDS